MGAKRRLPRTRAGSSDAIERGKIPRLEKGGKLTLPKPHGRHCAEFDGYSLHANTRVGESARAELERLCKYVCQPAISASRVEVLEDGHVRLALKTTWRDGTTHVVISRASSGGAGSAAEAADR